MDVQFERYPDGATFRTTDDVTHPVVRGNVFRPYDDPNGEFTVEIMINAEIAALGGRGAYLMIHEPAKVFRARDMAVAEKIINVWITRVGPREIEKRAHEYRERYPWATLPD